MKKLLMICALLMSMVITAFAHKIDYTTYDVIAKAGNVSVLAKDNDYRMVVGSLKKPKIALLLGYSKDQAVQKFERLLDITGNKNYSAADRQINFCGVGFHLTIKGSGDKEHYSLAKDGENVSFELSETDICSLKKSLEE